MLVISHRINDYNKRKILKKILSLTLLLAASLSLRAEQTIYFFEGFLQDPIEDEILHDTLWSKVDKFNERNPDIKLVRRPGETEYLVSALNDINTVGIIWIGHPNLIFSDNNTIVSGHLKSASGKYIPHHIFNSAHKNLEFISLIVCDDQIIYDEYLSGLSPNIKVIRPNSYVINNRKLVNLYSGPIQTFDRIVELINTLKTVTNKENNQQHKHTSIATKLEIKLTDLFSKFYSYNVFINNIFIGAIYYDTVTKNEHGVQKVSFSVRQQILKATNVLRIEPEHPERNGIGGDKFIDDIILLEATWHENNNVTPLLSEPLHLGDDTSNFDKNGLLYTPDNLVRFHRIPAQLRATIQW